MKYLVTIAFISTCLFSFGQSEMFWNNYANFNPAMNGFQHKQHASATYTNYHPALSGNYSGIYANAGANIANHHGVGISYQGDFISNIRINKVLLNYNYQFLFEKAGKLSLGTGMGIGRSSSNNSETFGDYPIAPVPATQFELNLGAAYNWKNLYVGFSGVNLAAPKQVPTSSYYKPRTQYNIHAQYAFQIAQKFQLTPRVLYSEQDGFRRLRTNLTVTYNQKFALGFNAESRDSYGINLGWDILNKFRVAYMYSKTISKLNNGASGGIHEFSIAYLLKNKPGVGRVITTPNF